MQRLWHKTVLPCSRRIQGIVSSSVRLERVGRGGIEGKERGGVAMSKITKGLIPSLGLWIWLCALKSHCLLLIKGVAWPDLCFKISSWLLCGEWLVRDKSRSQERGNNGGGPGEGWWRERLQTQVRVEVQRGGQVWDVSGESGHKLVCDWSGWRERERNQGPY